MDFLNGSSYFIGAAIIIIFFQIVSIVSHRRSLHLSCDSKLEEQTEHLLPRCPRCGKEAVIPGELSPGFQRHYLYMLFDTGRRKTRPKDWIRPIHASRRVLGCAYCGLIWGRIRKDSLTENLQRPLISPPKRLNPQWDATPLCPNCKTDEITLGRLAGYLAHRGGHYSHYHLYFSPENRKYRFLHRWGAIVQGGTERACPHCGLIFMEVDPIALMEFVRKHCRPGLFQKVREKINA